MNPSSWFGKLFNNEQPAPALPATEPQVKVPARSTNRGQLIIGGVVIAIAVAVWVAGFNAQQPTVPPARMSMLHDSDPSAQQNATRQVKRDAGPINQEDLRRAKYEQDQRAALLASQGQAQQLGGQPAPPEDPLKANRIAMEIAAQKKEADSYFANPVVGIVREPAEQERQNSAPAQPAQADPRKPIEPEVVRSSGRGCPNVEVDRESTKLYCVPEGTNMKLRVENRIVSEAAGPVKASLIDPILSRDLKHIVLPFGTTLLGEASAARSNYQDRMQIAFHRILLPDGSDVKLDRALGLDVMGAVGVRDRVNHHVVPTVLTTIAAGGLSALSTVGTGGYYNSSGTDMLRQGLGQSAAQTGQQMIGQQRNRPATLQIDEGKAIVLYLGQDIRLPEWMDKP